MNIIKQFSDYLTELQLKFKEDLMLSVNVTDLENKEHKFNFDHLDKIYGIEFTVELQDVVKRIKNRKIKCPLPPRFNNNLTEHNLSRHLNYNFCKILRTLDSNINKYELEGTYKSIIVTKIEYVREYGQIIYNIDVVKARAEWQPINENHE